MGDGGCVVTSDDALAERIRSVREYGWRTHYLSSEPGINTRLDELQAAFLNVLLPELPAKNAKRRALAELYRRELSGVPGLVLPTIPDAVEPVYHLYVVQCPDRDEVQRRLRDRGVGTAVHYPFPVHLQDAYRAAWRSRRTACPLPRRSCRASSACPCIPNSPRPTPLPSPEPSAMSFPL